MSENIIFYFTGTGNSLKVAKDIARAVGKCSLVSMGKPYTLSGSYKYIGFVYPSFCSGMPRVVETFIKSLDLRENKDAYIFGITTSGSTGGGLKTVDKIISSKGGVLSYGKDIISYANYVCMYEMSSEIREKAKDQDIQTATAIKDILNHKKNSKFTAGKLSLLHTPFLKIVLRSEKNMASDEKCNGCGTCAKVCPVANITMKNSKPVFGGRCEQCVACIQWCPTKALNCKNKTENRKRYHHPDITVSDIMAGNGGV